MLGLSGQELLIILLIVIVLFGGAKIPELLRGVGRGVGELQKGLEEGKRSLNKSLHDDEVRSGKRDEEPQVQEEDEAKRL